jgi:hypothetical protein
MKWPIVAIVIFFFLSPNVIANDRPHYSFSDNVFDDLPDFPSDFYMVKTLFEDGVVTAWQISDQYLQPELIPRWDYWSEVIYGYENYSRFGVYGLSFFPSVMNIYNVEAGDQYNLSAFIRADWGIKFYQGCRIAIPKVDGLEIKLIKPDNQNVLMSPTYPFMDGWLQKVLIEINVLKTGNYTVRIKETKPQTYAHTYWTETLGDDYVALGGLTESSWVIQLHQPVVKGDTYQQSSLIPFIGVGLVIILVFSFIAYCLRRYDAKREE